MVNRRLLDAPDRILVERSQDGDDAAFDIIIRRHSAKLLGYARQILRSTHEADDVVQETWVTAWRTLSQLQNPEALTGWLMRIVSNRAIDRIRAHRETASLDLLDNAGPDHERPDARAMVSSDLSQVRRVLGELPDLPRQCWFLREVGGYSYEEIAEQLEVSHSTVRGAISRARRMLITRLEGLL